MWSIKPPVYTAFGGTMETHEALKKVDTIIERPNFYPYMTAKENLKLVCKIKGIQSAKVSEKLEFDTGKVIKGDFSVRR